MKQLTSTQDTSFNLNKARHEVRQLGVKGLSKESKEDAILNKLIQLGAKVHGYCCPHFVCSLKSYKTVERGISLIAALYLLHVMLISYDFLQPILVSNSNISLKLSKFGSRGI